VELLFFCIIIIKCNHNKRTQSENLPPLKSNASGVATRTEKYTSTIEILFSSNASIDCFYIRGNPAKLLKGINPLEANLLEAASKSHIRFRLGGENFPPNIYYKIFVKSGVIDINAFAPRDYATLPRVL
jgi:hypothetical protein